MQELMENSVEPRIEKDFINSKLIERGNKNRN